MDAPRALTPPRTRSGGEHDERWRLNRFGSKHCGRECEQFEGFPLEGMVGTRARPRASGQRRARRVRADRATETYGASKSKSPGRDLNSSGPANSSSISMTGPTSSSCMCSSMNSSSGLGSSWSDMPPSYTKPPLPG